MTTSPPSASPQKFVRCPGCSERLGVRDDDAGRKARCTKCGRVFLIGGASAGADAPQQLAGAPAEPVALHPPEPAAPEYVAFECSLCQTRISAFVSDVGRKVACPDCGRKNVIPPPPKPKKSKPPAALSGEQLGLWGVDAKTWEPGFATAAQLHPVECKLCQTLMYATDEQIGAELRCPDCGTLTVARRRAPQKQAVLPVLTGEEYQFDPASAPTPRTVALPIAIRDAELHEHARATTVGRDGRLVVQKKEVEKRPVRPAVPLVQGVWRMLVTEELIARWLMISILFGAAGWLFFDALSTPGNAGLASFSAIMLLVAGMALSLFWVTFSAPMFLAIVSESSEGHDRLHEPPGWSPLDWMGETLYLIVACAAATMPGMLAWALRAPLPSDVLVAAGAGAALLIFPVALLGALLEDTPAGAFSPRLLSTLGRCFGPWLLFCIESAALVGAVVAAVGGLLMAGPAGALAAPFVAMAGALIYMRLLGRLAWWIGDLMPEIDIAEDVDDAAAAHPHLAAVNAARRSQDQAPMTKHQ